MSKQKKKKANVEAQQKLLDAQNRNEFKHKLNRICTLLGEPSLYHLFTGIVFEDLYQMRGIAPRVEAAEGHEIPKDVLRRVKFGAIDSLKNKIQMPLFEGGPLVTGTDFFQIVLPLYYLLDMVPTNKHLKDRPEIPKLVQGLQKLKNAENTYLDMMEDLLRLINTYTVMHSIFTEALFQADVKMNNDEKTELRIQLIIRILRHQPIWRTFGSGDRKRSAARVGWCWGRGLRWIEYEPALLGLRGERPLDVYMQQHALNRLYERIGCKYAQSVDFEMMISLENKVIIPYGNGRFLIEYRTSNLKSGYFLAEIVERALLVRTFLFLTHNGTPEGKKLAEITGLGKLDQKYLAFDNLLTLANSDILSNEAVKEIFRKAECGDLLELCVEIRKFNALWDFSDTEIPLADKLLNYMKTNQEDNWVERMRNEKFAAFEPEEVISSNEEVNDNYFDEQTKEKESEC